jgi:hypothetical protein
VNEGDPMKRFVAEFSILLRRLRVYGIAFLCGTVGLSALAWRWVTPLDMRLAASGIEVAFLYIGLLSVMIGALCIMLDQVGCHAERTKFELVKRVAEQDERIRRLEARLAALTPPTPTQ